MAQEKVSAVIRLANELETKLKALERSLTHEEKEALSSLSSEISLKELAASHLEP